jgi:hypothetical protein
MRFKEIVETTSAGGIATVAMPMGSVQKRRKEQSIYNEEDTDYCNCGSDCGFGKAICETCGKPHKKSQVKESISFKYKNIKSKEDYLEMKKTLWDILRDPMSMSDPETKEVAQQYMIKLNAEAEELGYR